MYRKQLRRLRRAGLEPGQSLLDYGCGGGVFLRYLRERGYGDAHGFDEYSDSFRDRAVLSSKYDCFFAQDVIEHVPDPHEFLRTADGLVKPGGLIALGTPNADELDLKRTEKFVHTLHEPYHRHILSRQALIDAGQKMGWQLERYYSTMYVNTPVPFVNHRFLFHYMRCFDDTLDVVNEDIKVNARLLLPDTLLIAFFGYFMPLHTDGMAIFRKPLQLTATAGETAQAAQ